MFIAFCFLKKMVNFPILRFYKSVIIPQILIAFVACSPALLLKTYCMNESFGRLVIDTIVTIAILTLLTFCIIFNKNEKGFHFALWTYIVHRRMGTMPYGRHGGLSCARWFFVANHQWCPPCRLRCLHQGQLQSALHPPVRKAQLSMLKEIPESLSKIPERLWELQSKKTGKGEMSLKGKGHVSLIRSSNASVSLKRRPVFSVLSPEWPFPFLLYFQMFFIIILWKRKKLWNTD